MVLFNYATREITAKVVYYGPGLCGKTTNLQFIYDMLPIGNKSKMLSLSTKTDRTLFFDFLPLELGTIRGMRTKLQLYTVPGQVFYNSTRQLVLKGADGIVFVADSQASALEANLESWLNLEDNLRKQGIRMEDTPVVMQYNKRDLPTALPVEELNAKLNPNKLPAFEAIATTGAGVEETLKGITRNVLSQLMKRYGLEGGQPGEKEIGVLTPMESSSSAEVEGGDDAPLPDMEIPPMTVDVQLPSRVLDSLPVLREVPTDSGPLIKEITLPVTLSMEELRGKRKLQLRIILEMNIV